LEKTVVLLKPDCVQRALCGEIISRFERKGLKIVGVKMIRLSESELKQHYSHLAAKPFFPALVGFMKSSPCIAMALEGIDAVKVVRGMCGVTNSRDAASGTVRGDYSNSVPANIVHASDSKQTAEKELKRFFGKGELFEWPRSLESFYYGEDERQKK
jgi:nucleoside-diphosphate kinase